MTDFGCYYYCCLHAHAYVRTHDDYYSKSNVRLSLADAVCPSITGLIRRRLPFFRNFFQIGPSGGDQRLLMHGNGQISHARITFKRRKRRIFTKRH